MITKNDYTFVQRKEADDFWHVQLKSGDYSGIVYRYGRIEVQETSDDNATLKFNYIVESIPDDLGMDQDDLKHDATFMNHLGDVLTHILEDAMESGQYKLGENDQSTDTESTMH